VETPAALLSALERLCASIDQEPVYLIKPLVELARELELAVHTYVGIEVTVMTQLGPPITLSDFAADTDPQTIVTSLRLPMAALTSGGSDGHVTFFGTRRGAFVDLAADLGFVLGTVGLGGTTPSPVAISLDQDLRPANPTASLDGAEEASTVNRAIGLLIGRGRTPDEAEAELVQGAQDAELAVVEYAHETLRLAEPPV
jgi:hypothetical protein